MYLFIFIFFIYINIYFFNYYFSQASVSIKISNFLLGFCIGPILEKDNFIQNKYIVFSY